MSMKAFKWAKALIITRNDPRTDEDPLTSPEAFVLLMLADHFNEEWKRAWPSQSTLAKETGLSVKTVVRTIDSLRGLGLIRTEEWEVNEGGRIPYRYCLPTYNRNSVPAQDQPVLAYAGWGQGVGYEDALRVPGSNLYIEADALTRVTPF